MQNTITSQLQASQSANSPPRRSDEELLSHYKREGDRRSFEALVHRYEGELYNYLRRYLGDAAMADDVFQATCLQVHLKCDQFEDGRRVRPWLYAIATNQAIDAQRRNKRHRMVSLDRRNQRGGDDDVGSLLELSASDEPGPVDRAEASERGGAVRAAVASLPEALRNAVNLIYYQGLKYREAAEVLAVPVGTVKSRLHAAVGRLSDMFGRTEFSEND